MQKVRIGKSIYTRKDATEAWVEVQHDSISLAKKANGLNSWTLQSSKLLPQQQHAAA